MITLIISFLVNVCIYSYAFPFNSPSPTVSVNFCDPKVPVAEYAIPEPPNCKRNTITRVDYCDATVHKLSSAYTNITVYVCQKSVTEWQATRFFFGSIYDKSKSYMADPPTSLYCQDWVHSLKAENIGDLKVTSENTWSTDNEVKYEYNWPTTTTGKIFNAHLALTTIYYDHIKGILLGPFSGLSTCSINSGSCTVGTQTIIWKNYPLIDCPPFKNFNSKMALHYNASGDIYRLDFPELGASIHQWGSCGPYVQRCFNTKTFCTNNALLFETHKCSSLKAAGFINSKYPKLRYSSVVVDSVSSTLTGFIQENTDRVTEVIINISSDINYLECQLESILTRIYKTLSKQYPGQILNEVLGGKHAAITVGDILTEIHCEQINVTILRSLYYNNTYATRPLVTFLNKNNVTIVAQIFTDTNVYAGIHFFENFVSGRTFTFAINGRYYTYINYTLTHTNAHIQSLRPSLTKINETFKPMEYQKIFQDMPHGGHSGFEDLNNILISINHLNLIKEKILLDHKSSSETNTNNQFTTTKNKVEDNFVNALSFISHPILSAFYMLAWHLGMFWGIVLTILVIKRMIPMLKTSSTPVYNRARQFWITFRNPAQELNPVEPLPNVNRTNREDTETAVPIHAPHTSNNLPNLYPNLPS
ncbi:uncharacterized protein LOC144429752 [Styela clava]